MSKPEELDSTMNSNYPAQSLIDLMNAHPGNIGSRFKQGMEHPALDKQKLLLPFLNKKTILKEQGHQ